MPSLIDDIVNGILMKCASMFCKGDTSTLEKFMLSSNRFFNTTLCFFSKEVTDISVLEDSMIFFFGREQCTLDYKGLFSKRIIKSVAKSKKYKSLNIAYLPNDKEISEIVFKNMVHEDLERLSCCYLGTLLNENVFMLKKLREISLKDELQYSDLSSIMSRPTSLDITVFYGDVVNFDIEKCVCMPSVKYLELKCPSALPDLSAKFLKKLATFLQVTFPSLLWIRAKIGDIHGSFGLVGNEENIVDCVYEDALSQMVAFNPDSFTEILGQLRGSITFSFYDGENPMPSLEGLDEDLECSNIFAMKSVKVGALNFFLNLEFAEKMEEDDWSYDWNNDFVNNNHVKQEYDTFSGYDEEAFDNFLFSNTI